MKSTAKVSAERTLPKSPTGIAGFDEITLGGLPKGRPSLICGGPGCGKTLFGLEFLVRGAVTFNEPGVCISFEETAEDLAQNVMSLGFDLAALTKSRKLIIDHIEIDKSQIAETGDYDLEGLFIRLGNAIDSIGARRVMLDTPEALFGGLNNEAILRAELRRLFGWLKARGVTTIITGERGEGTLTRYGIEEYVSDCVILLDHRVQDSIVTRRMRVMKYRGSLHGTSEYPFLIGQHGISILPVTSLALNHNASNERVSSGVVGLDEMLEGKGYFRGSSILATGTAGTGKTSLAAHLVDAACRRGETCLYFAFEESPNQLIRNMRTVGIDLGNWVKKGLLHIHATRPTTFGLEMHLVQTHELLEKLHPSVVVIDPLSSLLSGGAAGEVKSMVLRLIDHLKMSGATGYFIGLTSGDGALEATNLDVSSLVDTWLLVRDVEVNGERNRLLYVLKSRGMAHSNQVREYLITGKGIELRPAYLGTEGVLTGSARLAQEAKEREAEWRREVEAEQAEAAHLSRVRALEAQILALQAEKQSEESQMKTIGSHEAVRRKALAEERAAMASSRRTDPSTAGAPNGRGGRI